MKIEGNGIRRNSNHELWQKRAESAKEKTMQGNTKVSQDVLQLSQEEEGQIKSLKEQYMENTQVKLEEATDRMEQSKEEGKFLQEAMKVLQKCMKIATYIMSGDKVAKADEEFLSKNQPDLYMQALSVRKQKDDPEEHDQITEEENSAEGGMPADNSIAESSVDAGSAEAAITEAPSVEVEL